MYTTNLERIEMKKEIAYLLGYFYADGHLSSGKKYPVIELQEKDGNYLFKLAKRQLLTNKSRKRNRKNSSVSQIAFSITSKKYRKLFENMLSDKIQMNNIKNHIYEEDYPYFLRGFFDGDGCINISKDNSSRLYFYGSFDQDWNLIFDTLKQLNIKYTYQQIIRKCGKHKSSMICISNKCGINLLYEYIYPNRKFDFGLFRKYEKLNSIKGRVKSNHIKIYSDVVTTEQIKIYT